MKARSLHAKVCTLFVCLALMFANVAGAMGMASGDHAEMESNFSHCLHGSASMDMISIGSDHSDHTDHIKMTAMADSDRCVDDSSCIAECAANCASSALTGYLTLMASPFVASHVPRASQKPQSASISGLYKPPKNLH